MSGQSEAMRLCGNRVGVYLNVYCRVGNFKGRCLSCFGLVFLGGGGGGGARRRRGTSMHDVSVFIKP